MARVPFVIRPAAVMPGPSGAPRQQQRHAQQQRQTALFHQRHIAGGGAAG
jgi:hypothetical protein